eukprot:SAG22_NODE_994_length_6119_cov_167.397674_4_plen_115_part_00
MSIVLIMLDGLLACLPCVLSSPARPALPCPALPCPALPSFPPVSPGSHKALFKIPVDERASMDLACVRVPALDPGDVLFFGGPTHGAAAWTADPKRQTEDRRAVIFFYRAWESD